MITRETLDILDRFYAEITDHVCHQEQAEEKMKDFREGFAYKPKKEYDEDMDLGKMSIEQHMKNNPNPYDFFNKEDFNLGRFLGKIESRIFTLKQTVESGKVNLSDEDLYKLIEVVYEELNDISMEFEDL